MNKLITLTVLFALFTIASSQAPTFVSFFSYNYTTGGYTYSNYSIPWTKFTKQIEFTLPEYIDSIDAIVNVDTNQNYYVLSGSNNFDNSTFSIVTFDKNANVIGVSEPVLDVTDGYNYNMENVAYDSVLNQVVFAAQDDDDNAILYVIDFETEKYSIVNITSSGYIPPIGAYDSSSQTYYIVINEDGDDNTAYSLYSFNLGTKSLSAPVSLSNFNPDNSETYLNYANGWLYSVNYNGWPSTNFTLSMVDQESGLIKPIFTNVPSDDSDFYTDFWFANNYLVFVGKNGAGYVTLTTLNLDTLQYNTVQINYDFPFDQYTPSIAL